MVVLTAEDLSKSYGDRTLFEGVSFGISDRDRIGIIGANGAGKSTLLKILSRKIEPDSGLLSVNRQAKIEYLSQADELDDELTAIEQVLRDGPEAFEVLVAYEVACAKLELDPQDTKLLDDVAKWSEAMDRVDGWGIEGEAKAILGALGIKNPLARISSMSGGQRKRVALARALIRPSNLLILDEPTNHLDVDTVEWLETHLSQRQGALLLITHDRYFLDRVTNVVLELAEQTVFRHEGNYSYFLDAREKRRTDQANKEQRRAQLAKKELEWLRRGPKARTTKARARIDRAHALLDARYGPEKTDKMAIETQTTRLGKKVMEVRDLSKAFGELKVLDNFSHVFPRTERLGIIGPNGAGKSTLLNILTGREAPDAGEVEIGDTVVFGYYDQNSMDLDDSMRVHEYISTVSNKIPTRDGFLTAAQMLERFMFSRKRQWDYISKLSGGERRRLYLLKVLMSQPNVLLLDEPTNHLDVESLTVLEEYLDQFGGVLIVVSHDRYFLDRTVDHLLVYQKDSTLVEFPGSYTDWLDHRREQHARKQELKTPAPSSKPASKPQKLSYKEQRELESLAPLIEQLETRLVEIDEEMATRHDDYEALQALSQEKDQRDAELEQALERWMELEEIQEALKKG